MRIVALGVVVLCAASALCIDVKIVGVTAGISAVVVAAVGIQQNKAIRLALGTFVIASMWLCLVVASAAAAASDASASDSAPDSAPDSASQNRIVEIIKFVDVALGLSMMSFIRSTMSENDLIRYAIVVFSIVAFVVGLAASSHGMNKTSALITFGCFQSLAWLLLVLHAKAATRRFSWEYFFAATSWVIVCPIQAIGVVLLPLVFYGYQLSRFYNVPLFGGREPRHVGFTLDLDLESAASASASASALTSANSFIAKVATKKGAVVVVKPDTKPQVGRSSSSSTSLSAKKKTPSTSSSGGGGASSSSNASSSSKHRQHHHRRVPIIEPTFVDFRDVSSRNNNNNNDVADEEASNDPYQDQDREDHANNNKNQVKKSHRQERDAQDEAQEEARKLVADFEWS